MCSYKNWTLIFNSQERKKDKGRKSNERNTLAEKRKWKKIKGKNTLNYTRKKRRNF